jgi:1,2-dihydroxy-3-keto-5-methylthiopentene dioxygenase
MATMCIISESGNKVKSLISDQLEIAKTLSTIQVRFENRPVIDDIANGSDGQLISIDDARIAHVAPRDPGWSVVLSLVSINSNDSTEVAQSNAARIKFLGEHFHEEDELWFFLEGYATFLLQSDVGEVYAVVCGRGDLICLPAGIRHRFDMGKLPKYRAMRFFRTDPGFVGKFTDKAMPSYLQALDDLKMTLESH